MNCKETRRKISGWLDDELEHRLKRQLTDHLDICSSCMKEAESLKVFQKIMIESAPQIKSSPDFDAVFWKKVSGREKRTAAEIFFEKIISLIPQPSLAQAAAMLLIAIMIGGAGGAVSAMNAPQGIPADSGAIKSLSGFQEFKGVPKPSMASTYLQILEARELK